MVELKNLIVRRGGTIIVNGFSGSIEAGDFIVMVGTNGAGKSTLFDAIAGTLALEQGSIIFGGHDITQRNEQKRTALIGRLFQNPSLNSVGSLTVAQNLALMHCHNRTARLVNGEKSMSRLHAASLLQAMGLNASILDQPMASLSGGQRQAVAFIMATQRKPKLLLLDEPTAALDPQAATLLLQHVIGFVKHHRISTILITHDPYVALNVGNKIWLLEQGKLLRQYKESEKSELTPEHLIGHIDYSALKAA